MQAVAKQISPPRVLNWWRLVGFAAIVFGVCSVSDIAAQSQNWWRTIGNTPQPTDFLGTSNNSPLIIKTNNAERMRIASNGFIGIGTTNPQYVLDVNGRTKFRFNVYCDSLLNASQLVVQQDIQTNTINAQHYLINGQPAVFSQWTSISPNAIAFNGDVYVNTLNAQSGISIGNFRFRNGALPPQRDTIRSDKMVSFVAEKSIEFRADTVRFAEKVGIGKQPLVALDVNGDVAVSGSLKVGNLPAFQGSVMSVVVMDQNGNFQKVGPSPPSPPLCPLPGIVSSMWYVGGNSLTPTGCNVIGSSNAASFSIISGGAARINFSPTGEIGFGTVPPPVPPSTPAIFADPVRYEFFGSVSIRNNGNVGLFFGREYVPSSSAAYYYGQWGIQYVPASPSNNIPVGGLNFWKPYQSTGNASGQNALLFLNDDGKVGIGTQQPQCVLDVNPAQNVNGLCVKVNHNAPYGYGISFEGANALPQTKAFRAYWNGKERFVVYADGKTIIGDQQVQGTHSDAILQVAGKAAAKSFYVLKPTTWADDELSILTKPDVKKIEQYILENKHLPGVPSEAEIQREGYNVHEINVILLRKIEELYKIVIAQQREIDELKKR
jgi:hypothetical protein